jgi:hypothetical protein
MTGVIILNVTPVIPIRYLSDYKLVLFSLILSIEPSSFRTIRMKGIGEERFSLKGARSMHSFVHHHHSESGEAPAKETQGLTHKGGWRYDLMGWFFFTRR